MLARRTSKFGSSTMQPLVQTAPVWEKVKIKFKPFYVVFKGKLNIYATDKDGHPMLVHTLKPGNAFGYSDLLKVIVSVFC